METISYDYASLYPEVHVYNLKKLDEMRRELMRKIRMSKIENLKQINK